MPPKGDAKKPAGGVRGVSAEEKSRRMLEIFKSAEVYSLKELEKLGVKKGVLSQSIPDIVKGLVDDGLVDMDKIGGGNFYWALPSKQGQRKKARLDHLKADLSSAQDVAAREHARVGQLEEERQAPERATQLKRWDELKLLHVSLSLLSVVNRRSALLVMTLRARSGCVPLHAENAAGSAPCAALTLAHLRVGACVITPHI